MSKVMSMSLSMSRSHALSQSQQSPDKGAMSSEEEDIMMDPLKEIDLLRGQVQERDAHISMIEEDYTKCSAQLSDMERQVMVWREKYDRLYDSHKRVQKINQNLEEKLLQMADKCSIDKSQLARDIEILSLRLAESNHNIGSLQKENERYKNDMNLAIQLLHCKPDHFVSQKFDSLPSETQARMSSYIMSKARNDLAQSPTGKTATTPEKVNHQDFEFNISASLMSKILEESVQNTISKHCDTCTCPKKSLNPFTPKETKFSIGTQTLYTKSDIFCPNCNPLPPHVTRPSNVTSPLTPLTPITPITPISNHPMEISEVMEVKNIPEKKISIPSPSISKKQTQLETPNVPVHHSPVKNNSPVTNNTKQVPKQNEETAKLMNIKHKEIMDKIGENLNEMNMKHEFKFPPMEPVVAHHRLCDRTKHHTFQVGDTTECSYPKHEENTTRSIDIESCKPIHHSPKLVSTIKMADDIDMSFAQIENSIPIPNTLEMRQTNVNTSVPKSKADLNYIDTGKTVQNSSISSNEAESKTSSSRSWKNNGSYTGSNKVHIGPGPRFCSLRMQAGSKNILLDNAQPNIAPILYTRTRAFDTSPLSNVPLIDGDLAMLEKKDNKLSYHGHVNPSSGNVRNVYSNTSVTEEIPILDLPNEDLPLSKPIQVCEKPESGYKSNDSGEIIDKLLFGMDSVVQDGVKESVSGNGDNKIAIKTALSESKEKGTLETNKEKPAVVYKPSMDVHARNETVKQDRREALQNMKVFNFDQYERNNLRIHHTSKMFPSHKVLAPHLSYVGGKVPGGAQLILPEQIETMSENITSPTTPDTDVIKNVSESNKKFVRNIANQTHPEQVSGGGEKSSSSLSSDDSAAVLQKQQLIRVAEWVQKNLEMEHQIDMENSDSCQQSAEELHHVRNDFPRPAKVDHRSRKASLKAGHKSSHHSSKHAPVPKVEEVVCEKGQVVEEIEGKSSIVMSNWESEARGDSQSTLTSYTTRSYTREELARMEYNVKQFLLNGTRWTSVEATGKERRTSSKTETDLGFSLEECLKYVYFHGRGNPIDQKRQHFRRPKRPPLTAR